MGNNDKADKLAAEQEKQLAELKQQKQDQTKKLADEKLGNIKRMQGNGSLFDFSRGSSNTLG